MDIPLFVLILQIGFNAGLNYRGNNRIAMFPSSRLFNNDKTRRSASYSQYLIPSDSDSEQSDIDYSSYEETSFRSLPSFKNSYPRRKNPVKYDTEADNEASLEISPGGRLGSDNHVEPLAVSSKDKNYRRPYLRHTLASRRQGLHPKYEIDSLEDVVQRRAAKYLRLLFSIMDEQDSRRKLNYEKKAPINSLPTYRANLHGSRLIELANKRRNHEDKRNYEFQSRYYEPHSERERRAGNVDTGFFIPDERISDELPYERRKLRFPEPVTFIKHKYYNRRDDDDDEDNDDYDYEDKDESSELSSDDQVSPDDDIMNNYVQSFIEIKPLLESLLKTYEDASKRNDTITLETLLDKLKSFTNLVEEDIDDTEEVKALRLSGVEDFKSPKQKSRDEKHYNRLSDGKNTLRLLISPIDKVSLDENGFSDLSDILDDLKVIPVNLKTGTSLNKKHSRKKQNESLEKRLRSKNLRLEISDYLNSESPMLRNIKQTIRNNLKTRKNYISTKRQSALRHQRPYHKLRSHKHHKHLRNKNKYRKDDDKFSPGALKNDREDDYDYDTDFDDSFEGDLSVVRSTGLNENQSNQDNTTVTVIDIPATDQLSSENDNKTVSPELKPIKSAEKEGNSNESNDTLQLEFPWNDQLSPSDDQNTSSDSEFEELLRSNDSKDKAEEDTLDLEYPWNSVISPDNNKTNNPSALREAKTEEDTLELEYPWNSVISPEPPSVLRKPREETDKRQDTTDNLHLEFPWNDQLTPDDDSKELKKSQLRSIKKHNDIDHEGKPDHPVKSKASSGEGVSTEKIPSHSSDPLYEHPLLRQSTHQNDHTRLNDNSLLKQLENRPNLRQSDNNNNDQKYLRDGTNKYRNSDDDDDDHSIIMVPIDRRPHTRVRTDEEIPFILSRLGPQLRTQRAAETFNDTIIFPTD